MLTASVIRDRAIDPKYPDDGSTHAACTSHMDHKDVRYDLGIKFVTSSYEEIRSFAKSRDVEGVGDYLGRTYSYYNQFLKTSGSVTCQHESGSQTFGY